MVQHGECAGLVGVAEQDGFREATGQREEHGRLPVRVERGELAGVAGRGEPVGDGRTDQAVARPVGLAQPVVAECTDEEGGADAGVGAGVVVEREQCNQQGADLPSGDDGAAAAIRALTRASTRSRRCCAAKSSSSSREAK